MLKQVGADGPGWSKLEQIEAGLNRLECF